MSELMFLIYGLGLGVLSTAVYYRRVIKDMNTKFHGQHPFFDGVPPQDDPFWAGVTPKKGKGPS